MRLLLPRSCYAHRVVLLIMALSSFSLSCAPRATSPPDDRRWRCRVDVPCRTSCGPDLTTPVELWSDDVNAASSSMIVGRCIFTCAYLLDLSEDQTRTEPVRRNAEALLMMCVRDGVSRATIEHCAATVRDPDWLDMRDEREAWRSRWSLRADLERVCLQAAVGE